MKNGSIQLPKWLETRYEILWDAFGNSSFKMEDAILVLGEKNKDKKEEIPVFLSELRKAGWLHTELDPEDARRNLYSLKSKQEIIEKMFTINKKRLTRADIDALLKKAADLIRTRVDYKFILVLLFLKRISDKWELEFEEAYEEALRDGLGREEARNEARNSAYHDFDLPEEFLWDNIRKNVSTLPEIFSRALKTIAEKNPELRDVLDDMDFIHFATSRENAEILRQLVELFSEKKLHHVSPDILGDAYEWILRYFAPQKAKEGEVYTPREVISLLVEILDPKPGDSVYDPASASNGMLIMSYKYVEDRYGKSEAGKLFLYGQEVNQKTLALGRMNLYIHDIRNANIAYGDTLLYPKFKEEDDIRKFDLILANPPWNQDGYPDETLKKGEFWKKRFKYGFTPRQSADWAWIQHMLASAKESDGRVGVVIDNGCLFRGGKEKTIRTRLLEDDLIECVILLPEKLFYNTGAPGAVIILNRSKPKERRNRVLFINAGEQYEKHPDVRKLNRLGSKHTERIVEAYRAFESREGLATAVSIDDIREYEHNLNVTLYAFLKERVEEIDVMREWTELKELDDENQGVEKKIEEYLGILKEGTEAQRSKDSKIGTIPEDWRIVSLEDACEDITDGSHFSPREDKNGEYRIATVANIEENKIDVESCKRISKEDYEKLVRNGCKPKSGDVLFSKDGTVGLSFAFNQDLDIVLLSSIAIIKPKDFLDPDFFAYMLKSPLVLPQILGSRRGTGLRRVILRDLKRMRIPMPKKIQDQKRIAEILSTIDRRLELENEYRQRLERIKAGLMNDLLTGKKRISTLGSSDA
jgi:type I restriction enzyme M protein